VESRAVPEMTEESAAEATRAGGGGGGRSTVMEEVKSGATAAGRRGIPTRPTVPREKQIRSG